MTFIKKLFSDSYEVSSKRVIAVLAAITLMAIGIVYQNDSAIWALATLAGVSVAGNVAEKFAGQKTNEGQA